MKKEVKLLAKLAGLSLVGVIPFTVSNTVHANSWHNGNPKIMQGYWRTTNTYSKGHSRSYIKITKHSISTALVAKTTVKGKQYKQFDNGLPSFTKTHYRYLGKHGYQVKGAVWYATGTKSMKVRIAGKYMLMKDGSWSGKVVKISKSAYKQGLTPIAH